MIITAAHIGMTRPIARAHWKKLTHPKSRGKDYSYQQFLTEAYVAMQERVLQQQEAEKASE